MDSHNTPGAYQPPTSRTKCMALGIRDSAQGAVKTTCCLPKDHEGAHRNVRGEEWAAAVTGQALTTAERQHMADLEKQVAANNKAIEMLMAEREGRKVKKVPK